MNTLVNIATVKTVEVADSVVASIAAALLEGKSISGLLNCKWSEVAFTRSQLETIKEAKELHKEACRMDKASVMHKIMTDKQFLLNGLRWNKKETRATAFFHNPAREEALKLAAKRAREYAKTQAAFAKANQNNNVLATAAA